MRKNLRRRLKIERNSRTSPRGKDSGMAMPLEGAISQEPKLTAQGENMSPA